MKIEVFQVRRTIIESTRETIRPLICLTTKPKICQFKLQTISKDNNISRFNIPMNNRLLLKISSQLYKLNNKFFQVTESYLEWFVFKTLLKRILTQLQQQSYFISHSGWSFKITSLVIIFEYLNQRNTYGNDLLMLQHPQNLNLLQCLSPLLHFICGYDLQCIIQIFLFLLVKIDFTKPTCS